MTRVRFITSTLIGVVIASAAAAGAFDLYERGHFSRFEPEPIRSVRVGGQLDHVSRRELRRAVAPHIGAGFFGIDVGAVAKAAHELPWVARASVRRVWPDSLHIAVIEREAVARWGVEALVSARGVVFMPERTGRVDHLPLLVGPSGSSERVLQAYREVTRLLDAVGGGVRELALSARGIWRVRCANGVEIVLGDGHFSRLGDFAQIYEPLLGASADNVAGIDLRYTNGFAVRWRQEPLLFKRKQG